MSRIGKQPIAIPQGVSVSFNDTDRVMTVTGPHGTLNRHVRADVSVSVSDEEVTLRPAGDSASARALWGTYASHARNMIEGVTNKFEKTLVVEGVGYRVEQSGSAVILSVGFSHPVREEIPEGVEVSVEKNVITVRGADKEQVGGFAARLRSIKKPEPYKGKGIRYSDEVVRRKQGKKAA